MTLRAAISALSPVPFGAGARRAATTSRSGVGSASAATPSRAGAGSHTVVFATGLSRRWRSWPSAAPVGENTSRACSTASKTKQPHRGGAQRVGLAVALGGGEAGLDAGPGGQARRQGALRGGRLQGLAEGVDEAQALHDERAAAEGVPGVAQLRVEVAEGDGLQVEAGEARDQLGELGLARGVLAEVGLDPRDRALQGVGRRRGQDLARRDDERRALGRRGEARLVRLQHQAGAAVVGVRGEAVVDLGEERQPGGYATG
jgi:hypothetical protein